MALFELIAVVYFLLLAAAAPAANVSPLRRAVVAALAVCLAALAAAVALHGSVALRSWLPHLWLVTGYWLPALLTHPVHEPSSFERWLVRSDLRLRPLLPDVPQRVTPVTELAYLLCYPLVPASFAVVWSVGTMADIERFWVGVLAAGYACYATLPWLVSRPPRLLDRMLQARHVGAVNVFVLGRVSHGLNTFPSGHVAVAVAAAATTFAVSREAGAGAAAVAAAIAIGAAAGRYHFVVDVLLGGVVGAAAAGLAFWAR